MRVRRSLDLPSLEPFEARDGCTFDSHVGVASDDVESIVVDANALVVRYVQRVVIANDFVEIALRAQEDLLAPCGVLKGQLIVATASRRALRPPATARLVRRQGEG